LRWRLILDGAADGPRNMALDHALALALPPGEGVVRIYGWHPPTISFGRNEPARGRYDPAAARRAGISFVRRPTGGRAVLHDAEVTYAVVAPVRAFGSLRAAYRTINRGLIAGLRSLGAPVAEALEGPSLPPDAGPCFRAPAPGEVTAAGRKLVGSAQARIGTHLLQHGSLILRGDQSRLARLAGAVEDDEQPAALEALIGAVPLERVIDGVAQGLRLALGGPWTEAGYHTAETQAAGRLCEKYRSDAWTWRL